MLHKQGLIVMVLVYVDDLIVSWNDHVVISTFKTYFHTCFHMKDLGTLEYFLGVKVSRSPTKKFISQQKYALDIVSEARFLGCKPSPFLSIKTIA